MAIVDSAAAMVGATPMVQLSRLFADTSCTVLAKLELKNPWGSVKDRIAVAMIRDAEQRGVLQSNSIVVEASSGNTGIALAAACAALGYQCVVVMPEAMSQERQSLLKMYGARVELTPGDFMRDAVERAEAIVSDDPRAVSLKQFENRANPDIHRSTTAEEIWVDCGDRLNVFVAGVGTGGTVSGVGSVLKERNPDIKIIAVEPAASPVLTGGQPGPHHIQGIGAGFVPDNLDRGVVDEVVVISDSDAVATALQLARTEGILGGISSGANLAAVTKLAARAEYAGACFATMVCDTGERYLSTVLADRLE